MRTAAIVVALACAAGVSTARGDGGTNAPTLAERLCAGYEAIPSLSCQIRKITDGGGNTVRMLSRVHYRRPFRLHVEIVAPVHRRIIADGASLFFHEQGQPRGFSRPIDQLEGPWAESIHNVPATPVENLRRLRGLPEQDLPSTPELPVRRGYAAEKVYAVLGCDTNGRLTQIGFFEAADMKTRKATYRYAEFAEAAAGVWVPTLHSGEIVMPDGSTAKETRHVDNLEIGVAEPDSLFDAKLFFKGVEFTGDFKATYGP